MIVLQVTDPDAVNLLVGGVPPDVGYFTGTINQVAIFNGYLFANSSVCSLMDTSIVQYGRCTHYLTLGEICPPPTVESTEFCLEDLDRYTELYINNYVLCCYNVTINQNKTDYFIVLIHSFRAPTHEAKYIV